MHLKDSESFHSPLILRNNLFLEPKDEPFFNLSLVTLDRTKRY